MSFITSLFGTGNSALTAVFALAAVIVAILLVLWLLKLLFNASSNVGRGRNRRLTVVDSLALDPKRQLLIIRRDDVEHLILTGGPHDLVIETGIEVGDEATPQPTRRPVPQVASRKPAAHRPGNPAAPVPPVTPPQPTAAPATAIEQLRQLGQPTNKKAHLSLRHTGLLRPVNETEIAVSPENSRGQVSHDPDSAKEEARRDIEGSDFAGDNSEANRR